MNVSEQIIQVLDALCEKFGLAIDWTSANVVPYLTALGGKLIAYEIWTSVYWIGFMTVLAIAGAIATKRLYPIFKKGLEDQGWDEIGWSVASFFSVMGLVALYAATITIIGKQIQDIIKCVTFPEMYIVEHIQSIINAGS